MVRGPNWRYKDQDGGQGKQGVVKKVTNWNSVQRSAALVSWDDAGTKTYRVGLNGNVNDALLDCYLLIFLIFRCFPFSSFPSFLPLCLILSFYHPLIFYCVFLHISGGHHMHHTGSWLAVLQRSPSKAWYSNRGKRCYYSPNRSNEKKTRWAASK